MTSSSPADRAEAWPVEGTSDLFRSGLPFALRSDAVRSPDDPPDDTFDRVVLEHPGSSVVLAVDEDRRVCVLSQYRHPVGVRLVELPAGLLDQPGEEPLEVARRELREEAELAASDWEHLASTYPSPGILAEQHHIYLARGLSHAGRDDFEPHHEEADMEVSWVAFDDLEAAVLAGKVCDGPLVIAVLMARARGLLTPDAGDPHDMPAKE